jgi:hypothetical protein
MSYATVLSLTTTLTYYAQYTSNTTGLVWRQAASQGMVTDANANATIPQQAVALAEPDPTNRPGKFVLTHPTALPTDVYTVRVSQQLGGSPAAGDLQGPVDSAFSWQNATQALPGTNAGDSPAAQAAQTNAGIAASAATNAATSSATAVTQTTATNLAVGVLNASQASYETAGSIGASIAAAGSGSGSIPTSAAGTCQAGSTGNTIVLAMSASAVNNWYNGQVVQIVGGTGAGQAATIGAWTGATRTGTVFFSTIGQTAWAQIPDATSKYVVTGDVPAVARSIATTISGV